MIAFYGCHCKDYMFVQHFSAHQRFQKQKKTFVGQIIEITFNIVN